MPQIIKSYRSFSAIKLPAILLFVCLALASCSRVYAPAMYHQDIAYLPKPSSFDTVSSAVYASAGGNFYTDIQYKDLLAGGQVNLSAGHRTGNVNVAYGAFGNFGSYNSGTDPGSSNFDFKNKFFGAAGGRFSANVFTASGRTDFRYLGVEAAYSHEFGSYADFRKAKYGASGYDIDPRTDLFTLGLTSEILFHNLNDKSFENGIRVFLGTTLGHNPLNDSFYTDDNGAARFFRSVFPKVSYYLRYKDFFGTLEAGSQFMFRFGYRL